MDEQIDDGLSIGKERYVVFTNDEWAEYFENCFATQAEFLEFMWICDNWIHMKGDIWSRKIV